MAEVELQKLENIDWQQVSSHSRGNLYTQESLRAYEHLDILSIKSNYLVAIWPIPFYYSGNDKIAAQTIRLLPYLPPIIFKDHPLEQKKVLYKLIKYLQQNYATIDLPLGPNFGNITAFSAAGFNISYRNTHFFSVGHDLDAHLHPKARNHFKYAAQRVSILRSDDFNTFDFQKGIVTNNHNHRLRRRTLIENIFSMHAGCIFSAVADNKIVGQAVVVHDKCTAYLFHSWFDRDNNYRGAPTYLVKQAIDWSFKDKGLVYFDLEGSVLPSVDYFFSSLGGLHKSFAHVQWSNNKDNLIDIIKANIFSPEKLDGNFFNVE